MMVYLIAVLAAAGQGASIGSGLAPGAALVYESGGVAQAPWIYDAVEVVARAGFERCARVQRRGQAVRETCVREGVLFEPDEAGGSRALRPIGPGMRLEVATASG
jgi:hypothetical protein